MEEKHRKQVAVWLLCGCLLIFLMVILGGITRLTGSGLSITEWNVIMGAIPPLNEKQWQDAFDQYKQIPQFQKLNYDYGLADFKRIFFWEYLHRLIGRTIGLVFVVPFIYFLYKRKLNAEWIRKSILLFALGALQGFLGWFMVKSGLSERTSVSHYRLAIHLLAAFITFGVTYWFALQLLYGNRNPDHSQKMRSWLRAILVLVVIQITYGAFVAGLHAGRIANTFPTMDGAWIPEGLTALEPGWKNFFENQVAVQFIHRCLAVLLSLSIVWLWIRSKLLSLQKHQHAILSFCLAAVLLQFLLGVLTLLYHVPVVMAVLHQVGGFFLFTCVLSALFVFSEMKLVAH